jgi:ABC-type polysaccharide/polyol phosphate export permease
MTQAVRVIRPDERLNEGVVAAVRHLWRELVLHREHIRAAFVQDFRNLSHGTFFGVAWNIILPLVPVMIYVLLAYHRVLPNFEDVDGATSVALGAAVWFLLAGCLQQPLQTVRSRNAEVMKTALPLSAMVVSGFAQVLFDTVVRTVFVAVLVLITSAQLQWSALLVPLALIPAVLLFLGLGLILSVANVIYADVGRVTGIAIQYGLFLSGVIFPVAHLPFGEILALNPAYVLIEAVRILAFRGLPEATWLMTAYAGLGIGLFLLGCKVFYLMEYRIRGIN